MVAQVSDPHVLQRDDLQQTTTVSACLLSIASNIEPKQNLALAKQFIESLGSVVFSDILIGECDTHPNLPAYHNEVAYVELNKPMPYLGLVKLTKHVEQQAKRGDYQKPLVTLDVDIMAVRTDATISQNYLDEKHEKFIMLNKQSHWYGINRRFPLAIYDRQGIKNLAQQPTMDFLNYFL